MARNINKERRCHFTDHTIGTEKHNDDRRADRVEEQLKQDGAEFTRHAHINEEANGGVEQRQQLNTSTSMRSPSGR